MQHPSATLSASLTPYQSLLYKVQALAPDLVKYQHWKNLWPSSRYGFFLKIYSVQALSCRPKRQLLQGPAKMQMNVVKTQRSGLKSQHYGMELDGQMSNANKFSTRWAYEASTVQWFLLH